MLRVEARWRDHQRHGLLRLDRVERVLAELPRAEWLARTLDEPTWLAQAHLQRARALQSIRAPDPAAWRAAAASCAAGGDAAGLAEASEHLTD